MHAVDDQVDVVEVGTHQREVLQPRTPEEVLARYVDPVPGLRPVVGPVELADHSQVVAEQVRTPDLTPTRVRNRPVAPRAGKRRRASR